MRKRNVAYKARRARRRNGPMGRRARAARLLSWQKTSFEEQLNRALFGSSTEPSWNDLRNGARMTLMGAQGVDPAAARKIWESNTALPIELRTTDSKLLERCDATSQR